MFAQNVRALLPALKVFFNVPNCLSHLRVIAVWPIYLFLKAQSPWAFWVYAAAVFTDFLDGKAALKFNQKTEFGKLYDPLADKVLHLGILAIFWRRIEEPVIPFFTVLFFAIILASLPGLTTLFKIRRPMGANLAGKLKMSAEAVAIVCLFYGNPWTAKAILWWLAIPLAGFSIILHLTLKKEFSALEYVARHSRLVDRIYRRFHGQPKTNRPRSK